MLLTYGFTYCIFSDLNCGCLYRDSNYGQCRLPIFDVPSEIQKKVKKNKQKKEGQSKDRDARMKQNEWGLFDCLVRLNPLEGRAVARQISTMMLWLNGVPSSNMLHKSCMHKGWIECSRGTEDVLEKCDTKPCMWSHAQTPQRCTWVLKCLHIHRRACPQQADWEHIVMIGGWRIPLQGVHLIG